MSITDGTYFCALCGDWRTGCNLCVSAPMIKAVPKRFDIADEVEGRQQERSIRRAAQPDAKPKQGE